MGFDTCDFKKNISEILQHDYGDFMRTANLYLNDLRNILEILFDKNINTRLDSMQIYLQFSPNWDVESTRVQLFTDTQYIDDLLMGHSQDWESANLKFDTI